jgi:hypothetical protein
LTAASRFVAHGFTQGRSPLQNSHSCRRIFRTGNRFAQDRKPEMTTENFDSFADLRTGSVFTPPAWAAFAIEKYGLLELWLGGKTFFDPTMGEGNLLAALVEAALKNGHALADLPLANLFGLEINTACHRKAREAFMKNYGTDMGGNFFNADILAFNRLSFDVLFGNPPWCNFADLPPAYKKSIKPFFFEYGLIDNSRKMLLGNSRIDLAALVIQKTITENLKENGEAVFFLPLSLFLNGGAHGVFRRFTAKGKTYSLSSVYDFEKIDAFPNISTRYGLARFEKKNPRPGFVPYFRFENGAWAQYKARAQKTDSPFLIPQNSKSTVRIPRIEVPADAQPRQGINPCGAVSVFVFCAHEPVDEARCKVNAACLLPRKYIYPLITSNNFKNAKEPLKWVLLPYNARTGKPLSVKEMEEEPLLFGYLQSQRHILANRKGSLIQTQIRRGLWWSLLGVGPYSFCPYKVVWEAYGKNTFRPRIFPGNWQANQSLQAFIPCANRAVARQILARLSNPLVEQYLMASRMEGTMTWAQPGRIRSILRFQS